MDFEKEKERETSTYPVPVLPLLLLLQPGLVVLLLLGRVIVGHALGHAAVRKVRGDLREVLRVQEEPEG